MAQSASIKLGIRNSKFEISFFRSSGQSLIELLVAIGLSAVLLPALITGLVSSREGKAQEGQRLQATAFLKEAEEAVRSVREKGWSNLAVNGTYYPEISGSSWALTSCGGSCPITNGYTRQIVISDAQREPSSGNIVTSGGTTDNSTKKVVSTVSWGSPLASNIEFVSYYQRYLGNSAWLQTTDTHFNAGSHNNTQTVGSGDAASVELIQSGEGGGGDYGNKFWVGLSNGSVATSGIVAISRTNGAKASMRFTAQESKSVSAARVFVHTKSGTAPTYRIGIQTNNPSGNIPSGTWVGGQGTFSNPASGQWTAAITLSPAATLTAGQIYHLVIEASGGSGSGNITIRRSEPLNLIYPKTQAADPQSNTLNYSSGTWASQGYQPIYDLYFNDAPQTYEGNPYESSTETSIFGSNWYGEKFTVSGPDKTLNSISFCIRKVGTPPNPLTVEIRDVPGNTTIYSGLFLTSVTAPSSYTCPGSWQSHTFSPSSITLSAGSYRVFLRTVAGNSNNSYRFYRLNTTNTTNFTSITYDGTNSVYTNATSPGSTWTDSNQYDITFFFTIQGSVGYPSSGQFTSQLSPNFGNVGFNYITWTASTPAGTSLTLEVSIDGNPYLGPFSAPSSIPLPNITGSTVRFRATLNSSGDGLQTPTLNDLTINYSP